MKQSSRADRHVPPDPAPRLRAESEAANRWVNPERFANIFAKRGGIYVKVAQFFAMRPDLVPQEYCNALLKLTDQVVAFSWDEARVILVADLRQEPEQAFAWIDRKPLAAASLSQVHRARTHGGDDVVVKIRRPAIAEDIGRQLRSAGRLLRMLELSGWLPGVRAEDMNHEIAAWMTEELDFRRELSKVVRVYDAYAGQGDFRVPRPYPELSGDRVVTMEYLRGVPMSEVLKLARSGAVNRIESLGFDPDELASGVVSAMLNQIFRYQLFHGDPHPGNLLAMPGNVIGFVDFGLVHELDPGIREQLGDYMEAVYREDAARIYAALVEILQPEKGADLEAFRIELVDATRAWSQSSSGGSIAGDGDSPIANYLVAALRAARRHRLRLPPSVLAMYRSILTANALAAALGSPSALTGAGSRIFGRLRIEKWLASLTPDRVGAQVLDLVGAFAAAPDQLGRLLAELSDGRFVLPVRTSDSPADRRDANNRAKLVVMAVLSVAIAILLGGAVLADLGPGFVYPLGGLLFVNYIALIVIWRRTQ